MRVLKQKDLNRDSDSGPTMYICRVIVLIFLLQLQDPVPLKYAKACVLQALRIKREKSGPRIMETFSVPVPILSIKIKVEKLE
jgi:hypothetical protein